MMFHYKSCGLSNIWLDNGYTIMETGYGQSVSIHDLEGLHAAIGLDMVNNRAELAGNEVCFLRKELDMPQVQLAQLLGVSESSLRNWENGRARISTPADRLLRLLYVEHVKGEGRIRTSIDRLSRLNRKAFRDQCQQEYTQTAEGWKSVA